MGNSLDALKTAVGYRVRSERRRKDISQEDLAARIGRTTAALSNIERGRSLPPLDTLLLIAEELSVPISAFFVDLDASAGNKRLDLQAELHAQLGGLSDDKLATALRLVKALDDER